MDILIINDTVKSCVPSVLRFIAQKCETFWNLSIMTLMIRFLLPEENDLNPGAADHSKET